MKLTKINNATVSDLLNSNQAPQEPTPMPDTALICLSMIAKWHEIAIEPEQIAHEFRSDALMSEQELLIALQSLKLKAKKVKVNFKRLQYTNLPAIMQSKEGDFFILAKVTEDQALIQSPLSPKPLVVNLEDLKKISTGELILITSRASLAGELAKFDFSWFVPAVVKYRKLLVEILIMSLCIQGLALLMPLFFQVVMDKVLVHQGFSTLDVVAVGLLVVSIFSITLTGLRSYLFAHTSSRIDVELGAKLFKHLLSLPLNYFQSRRVGDSVARIQELENIRSFLTGNAMTIVLDLLFSVVFLALMFFYSPKLTLIVVISLPCYFIVSLVITPVLRQRLNEKFNKGAENQSFLVESISSVDTIKSSAIEPQWRNRWEKQLASYVQASFKTSTLSIIANHLVTLIDKLVVVALMYFGALLVIEGKLSVGELIAFNMLSQQVSQPIIRLAQLWNDFQQVGISMQRLADILNAKTELQQQKHHLPQIMGAIEFEDIDFRYQVDGDLILKKINLNIKPGEVIGIVGRSGSGKSTLTKLVQRLYIPEQGRLSIDDIDVSTIDPSSLRRQMGVVLQENRLFNRSIRDNIAIYDPACSIEKVIQAAKLGGAHEFICQLPNAYDTIVEEHGSNLSGGQRQRIAIARALIHQPKILIFDEATSALDYESEYIIQQNMQAICQGRTVLIIAHRLSAVRNADRIIVMDKGVIIEQGTHDELLKNPQSHYAYLHQLQQR